MLVAALVATRVAECRAAGALSAALDPAGRCEVAIRAAEQRARIPPRLLTAIGLVESGRDDPRTGIRRPWPWTVDVEGQGYFYDTKAEAIAAVRNWRARGVRSIDVGCMQVNLMHHPDAFTTLQDAFDPVVNAAFASKFLMLLFQQTGDWTKAAAAYHSTTPTIAAPYVRKVVMLWQGEGEQQRRVVTDELAQAWRATLSHPSEWTQASLAILAQRSGRLAPECDRIGAFRCAR